MKYAFFFSIIFFAGFSACKHNSTTAENASPTPETSAGAGVVSLTAEQLQNANITVGMPQMRTMGTPLKVNGFMETPPSQLVSVSFPLGGYLKSIKLMPGMPVRRGDVLAVLEDPQYISLQQDYLHCKARLEYLSADLARQENLNRDQSASDKSLQLAKAEYQTQYITSKALAEKLRLIGIDPQRLSADALTSSVTVRAAIDGYVSEVKVHPGQYIAPTDILFELVDKRNMHLHLRVFEKDLKYLRIGQKVKAYTNADPSTSYAAHITLIGQTVDNDRSVAVHCHLQQMGHSLLPGMFMTAEIEADNRSSYSVPTDAIVRFENKHYIFAVQAPGAFEMTEVVPGTTQNGFTELTGDIETALGGRQIVLQNAYTLLMKMKNTPE